MLGFTINMITLMALSLCVGLLIDDAIVVRENIVRHVQMGKAPTTAAMDGTQEIGLAVLATTLSIVAVFLPIGFMGGIIGKFFHEFRHHHRGGGDDLHVRQLHARPHAVSSVWHDPAIHAHGQRAGPPATLYDKTIGRVTACVRPRAPNAWPQGYQNILRWALVHKPATLLTGRAASWCSAWPWCRCWAPSLCPRPIFLRTTVDFHTPGARRLEATEAKARQVEAIVRELPEVRYTCTTINTGNARGQDLRQRVRAPGGPPAAPAQRGRYVHSSCASASCAVAGITVTHVGLLDPVGEQSKSSFPPGAGPARAGAPVAASHGPGCAPFRAWWTWTPACKPDKPVDRRGGQPRRGQRPGPVRGAMAASLRTLVAGTHGGQLARRRRPDLRRQRAPGPRGARTAPQDLERLPFALTVPMAAPASCA